MTVALPEGGGAYPRYDITTVDRNFADHVLPILVLQLLSTCVVVVSNVASIARGREAHVFDLIRSLFSSVLLTVAFAFLHRAGEFVTSAVDGGGAAADVFQVQYVAAGIDGAAEAYHTGISAFGFWLLFFVAMMGRFLRDVPGLELVVQILQRSAFELACLVAAVHQPR